MSGEKRKGKHRGYETEFGHRSSLREADTNVQGLQFKQNPQFPTHTNGILSLVLSVSISNPASSYNCMSSTNCIYRGIYFMYMTEV